MCSHYQPASQQTTNRLNHKHSYKLPTLTNQTNSARCQPHHQPTSQSNSQPTSGPTNQPASPPTYPQRKPTNRPNNNNKPAKQNASH